MLATIIGWMASIALALGYLPQAIKTMRTRRTDDISLLSFVMMAIGAFFFAIQGFLLDNYPLLATNCITTVSSAIVFGIKMHNDYFKKK